MSRYCFDIATQNDSPEILEILEESDYPGLASQIYTRQPNAINSFNKEGEFVEVLVCRDKDANKLISFGVYAIQSFIVGKKLCKGAYIFSLRVRKEYRHKNIRIFMEAYQYLKERIALHRPDFIYSTILAKNIHALQFFNKRHRNIPTYRALGNYTVYSFKPNTKLFSQRTYRCRSSTDKDKEYIKAFLEKNYSQYDYYPKFRSLNNEFQIVLNNKNEIVCLGQLTDTRDYKQYILKSSHWLLKILSRISFLPIALGLPAIPRVGSILNFVYLSTFCIDHNYQKHLPYFLKLLSERASSYDFINLGLYEQDPLNKVMKKIPHYSYKSILHQIIWEKADFGQELISPTDTIFLECLSL